MKFRLPELEIPSDDPFRNDALERKPAVEFLAGLLDKFNGPFVLALDSPWGTGKTTLVRMLKAKLEQANFQCVYFNAWQTDFVDDPLVALVSELDCIDFVDGEAKTTFKKHLTSVKKITTAVAKRGLIAGAKAATLGALDLEREFEAVAADVAGGVTGDAIDAFQKEKAALKKLRDDLEAAVAQLKEGGKRDSLIFFIDELDRCRPTFAIELLERIKHLFDLSNIVFVLSVDKAQLSASVASVYGEKSDTQEYLRRFFDLEFGIPKIDSKRHTTTLLTRFGMDDIFVGRRGELQYDKSHFVDYFSALADVFQLSLRARERCVTMLAVVMHQTPENHYLDAILVSYLIALRTKQPESFRALCKGTLSVGAAMEALKALPGGSELVADRPGMLIESYLLAGDPNTDRVNAHYKKLEDLWKSNEGDPAERSRAQEMLNFRNRIVAGYRNRFDYRTSASKIDVAVSFRD
ncbi:hypothetical protein CBP34_10530 [Acidovorax carolinensis]|uniref:KAP NTPase domain-containing protein n=1 Tax=Acidovorax carolinensis TaxID=553814 RepID=A0A240U2D8_9BURK|nr:P-loop NTPase fold protein [Acidovorax carolinensis]ART52006.1 hypothetical protein CBP34_10530 [Acidovorax carolinensis]